jgi:hypothetical protein
MLTLVVLPVLYRLVHREKDLDPATPFSPPVESGLPQPSEVVP